MNDPSPPSKIPSPTLSPLPPKKSTKSNERRRAVPYYLAGYVLNREVAFRLERHLTHQPFPPEQDRYYFYPFLSVIQEKIVEHLRSIGQDFDVYVTTLAGGGLNFDYMIATKGGVCFEDSPPERVEDKTDIVVRELLEANGVAPGEYRWEAHLDIELGGD